MLPSGLPEQIGDHEDLARFLTQGSQYTQTVVKPSAFLPWPKDRETSVFRHGREPRQRLWEIGAEAAGSRALHGAAIVRAGQVRAAQLSVESEEPPARHAAIRGWPWLDTDADLQKARQKELAAMVASAAGPPVLRDSPS